MRLNEPIACRGNKILMRIQIKSDTNHMVKVGDRLLIIFCTQLNQLKAQWKKWEEKL